MAAAVLPAPILKLVGGRTIHYDEITVFDLRRAAPRHATLSIRSIAGRSI